MPPGRIDRTIAQGVVGFGSWEQLKLDFTCGAAAECDLSDKIVGDCKCSQECSYSECTRAPRFGEPSPTTPGGWCPLPSGCFDRED